MWSQYLRNSSVAINITVWFQLTTNQFRSIIQDIFSTTFISGLWDFENLAHSITLAHTSGWWRMWNRKCNTSRYDGGSCRVVWKVCSLFLVLVFYSICIHWQATPPLMKFSHRLSKYDTLRAFNGQEIVYLNEMDSCAGWSSMLVVVPQPNRLKGRVQTHHNKHCLWSRQTIMVLQRISQSLFILMTLTPHETYYLSFCSICKWPFLGQQWLSGYKVWDSHVSHLWGSNHWRWYL